MILIAVSIYQFELFSSQIQESEYSILEDRNFEGESQGVEYPIPEGAQPRITPAALVEKGERLWFDVNDQGDVVYMMSPSVMYLPKDIKNYKQYYQLLAENTLRLEKFFQTEGGNLADCLECHLKITIGKHNKNAGAYPIVKVEQLSKEELQELKAVYDPTLLKKAARKRKITLIPS